MGKTFDSFYKPNDFDLTSKYANNLNTQAKNSQSSFPLETFQNAKQYEPISNSQHFDNFRNSENNEPKFFQNTKQYETLSNSQHFDKFNNFEKNETRNSPTKKNNFVISELKTSPNKKPNLTSEINLNPTKDLNISHINYNYDKKITDSLTTKQWEQPIFLKVNSYKCFFFKKIFID